MSLTEADYKRYAGTDGRQVELETSLMDAAVTGFKEGWASSPFMSIVNYAKSTSGRKYMTPMEANKKYNLTNTPYAFKDGDELISDEHAENVMKDNLYRESYEIAMERVEQDYSTIGSVFNFAGNLASGFADPINLAVSFGTGLAMAKGVTKFGTTALKEVIKNPTTYGDVFARELVLNGIESTVIDMALTPVGEEAVNREVDLRTRITNVLGGTILGGFIGTAFELPAIRRLQQTTAAVEKSLGSRGPEVMERATIHATMNVANNKVPNPNHPLLLDEMEVYNVRPHQKQYIPEQVYSDNIYDRVWHIGRDINNNDFEIISGHGKGTIVLTDNVNVAHNRVQPLDNTRSGEVVSTNVSKNAKILTDDIFVNIRADVRQAIINTFDKLEVTNKASRSKFISRINTEIDKAVSFNDFKDDFRSIIGEQDASDVHNIGDIDDFFNKALHDELGFNGYHAVGNSTILGDTPHNMVVLFRPEVLGRKKSQMEERYYPTQNSLFVGKGLPDLKNITGRGVVESSDGFGIFYNSALFDGPSAAKTTPFDPNAVNADNYLRPMKDAEKAEIKRMNDHTQDLDYDKDAAAAARSAKQAAPEEYDSVEALAESEGIDLNEVDPEMEEAQYIKKSDEEVEKPALEALDECMRTING